MRLVKIDWIGDSEAVMMVNHRSLLDRLFGWPGYNRAWRGSCTVWHDTGSGRRAQTGMEFALCDLWTKAYWDRQQMLPFQSTAGGRP